MLLAVTLLVGCNGLIYSGTKGGKTKFQDVKTEVIELKITHNSDMRQISDVFCKDEEGIYFKEEYSKDNEELVPINEETFNKLSEWVDEYNIKSWNNY